MRPALVALEVQLGAQALKAGGLVILKFRPITGWSQGARLFRAGPQPMVMENRA